MQIRHPTEPDQSCSCKSRKQFQPDQCWSGKSAFQTWIDQAQSEQAYQNSQSDTHKVHIVESREETVDRLPRLCSNSTTTNPKQVFHWHKHICKWRASPGYMASLMGHKRSQRPLYCEQLVQSKQSQQWTKRVHTSGQCTGNWTNTFHSEEPSLGTSDERISKNGHERISEYTRMPHYVLNEWMNEWMDATYLPKNVRIYSYSRNSTNTNTNNIRGSFYLNIRIFILITDSRNFLKGLTHVSSK